MSCHPITSSQEAGGAAAELACCPQERGGGGKADRSQAAKFEQQNRRGQAAGGQPDGEDTVSAGIGWRLAEEYFSTETCIEYMNGVHELVKP